MMTQILHFFYAYIATMGFAVLFQVPRKTLLYSGFSGAFGWTIFQGIKLEFGNAVVATFIGAMIIAMIGERFARKGKHPFTVYVIPAIVPLVPGLTLYRTMLAILEEDYHLAAEAGSEALLVALAIAGGLTIILSINSYLRKKRMELAELRARKKQRLLEKKGSVDSTANEDLELHKEIEKAKIEDYYQRGDPVDEGENESLPEEKEVVQTDHIAPRISAKEEKKILILAMYAGEIMVKNGSETYRVEDTIQRICRSAGIEYVESLVTPTGIHISVDLKETSVEHMLSSLKRIQERLINLDKVSKVNDFSRRFVMQEISIEEGMRILKRIDEEKEPYSIQFQAISAGIASAFFILLVGASLGEFTGALLSTIIMTYALRILLRGGFPSFFAHLAGGMIAAFLAIFIAAIFPEIRMNVMIVGGIMVMVPGVAITNSLRDTVAGDLVSGMTRGLEAMTIAVSIAFGVGFMINLLGILF